MNDLDKQYTALLQDILDNGVTKQDRTGTGTLSVFGRQIRHKMSEGFPLLTTKKMTFKTITTELLWFLRGDTNIKFLVDNGCHIWDGDAYKNYCEQQSRQLIKGCTYQEFINKIKTDDEFAKKWGELGPVYGKQWRNWYTRELMFRSDVVGEPQSLPEFFEVKVPIDQIQNLITDLKTNPDSRRLMVSAWNVGELDSMTLPPCHYGFQVYTRELDIEYRAMLSGEFNGNTIRVDQFIEIHGMRLLEKKLDEYNIPKRAISLMWNQRSVDTFLGLPFNIASYGLLLEIIAKSVNMVPDELIGNLGDTHLYLNHIEQAKEQIGRELTLEERYEIALPIWKENYGPLADMMVATNVDNTPYRIPTRTRQPYPLPTLNINTEFWPTESGECGVGPVDAQAVFNNFTNEHFCKCLLEEDLQLANYQSHPTIKAPLSN
jgi:thymidylate synthase